MKFAVLALVALFGIQSSDAAVIHVVSCSNSTYSFNIKAIVGVVKGTALTQGTYSKGKKELATVEMQAMMTPQYTAYPYREVYGMKNADAETQYTLSIGKMTATGNNDYVSKLEIQSPEAKTTRKLICRYTR